MRPRGHSRAGEVEDGRPVTGVPLGAREYLPLVKATQNNRSLIGNHRRGTNGWVGRQAVAGLATAIAPARR